MDIRRPVREWPLDQVDVAVLAIGHQEDHSRTVHELALSKIQVLLIGVGWTRARLEAAVSAGAAGCLVKDTRIGGLATAVRSVASGHAVLSPELLGLYRSPARREPSSAAPPVLSGDAVRRLIRSLTDREQQVLTLLAEGSSTVEAAEALSVSPATVKSHISHALGKLGVRNRLEAVLLMQRLNGE
ncbi:response regulator transcription factor [Kitasatospora sp. McL0602]|uniref:response regulator transcription factor n=1 Tax=Kitasatospora sp. McL0602 TaxID=3439530 RepID=UPI003F8B6A80